MNPRQRGRRGDDLPGPAEQADSVKSDGADERRAGEPDEKPWAGYDLAIAEAIDRRDKALDAARERLNKVLCDAYADYGEDLKRIQDTFDAARAAAMKAHEAAQDAAAPAIVS